MHAAGVPLALEDRATAPRGSAVALGRPAPHAPRPRVFAAPVLHAVHPVAFVFAAVGPRIDAVAVRHACACACGGYLQKRRRVSTRKPCARQARAGARLIGTDTVAVAAIWPRSAACRARLGTQRGQRSSTRGEWAAGAVTCEALDAAIPQQACVAARASHVTAAAQPVWRLAHHQHSAALRWRLRRLRRARSKRTAARYGKGARRVAFTCTAGVRQVPPEQRGASGRGAPCHNALYDRARHVTSTHLAPRSLPTRHDG